MRAHNIIATLIVGSLMGVGLSSCMDAFSPDLGGLLGGGGRDTIRDGRGQDDSSGVLPGDSTGIPDDDSLGGDDDSLGGHRGGGDDDSLGEHRDDDSTGHHADDSLDLDDHGGRGRGSDDSTDHDGDGEHHRRRGRR
jgi:hypothetical protein